jgi:hypothetical protein
VLQRVQRTITAITEKRLRATTLAALSVQNTNTEIMAKQDKLGERDTELKEYRFEWPLIPTHPFSVRPTRQSNKAERANYKEIAQQMMEAITYDK